MMANIQPLSAAELKATLHTLDGWSVVDGKLHGEFLFADFVSAFAFMTKVAFGAERMNHHPEWRNVYNRVTIDLVTHEADDQISRLDVELAEIISRLIA